MLLAGFVNLLALAVLAPPLGRALRRRRPDLPRLVASNYAGAALVVARSPRCWLAGGLAHRSAVQAEDGREQAVAAPMHAYVVEQAPQYRDSLGADRRHPHRPRLLPRLRPGRRRATTGSACS